MPKIDLPVIAQVRPLVRIINHRDFLHSDSDSPKRFDMAQHHPLLGFQPFLQDNVWNRPFMLQPLSPQFLHVRFFGNRTILPLRVSGEPERPTTALAGFNTPSTTVGTGPKTIALASASVLIGGAASGCLDRSSCSLALRSARRQIGHVEGEQPPRLSHVEHRRSMDKNMGQVIVIVFMLSPPFVRSRSVQSFPATKTERLA